MDEPPEAPEFLNEIPESVFGKVIKSRTFREALFAEDADVRQVLDEAGIYISDDGLRQLQSLITLERGAKTLSRLDGTADLA
jgi:hypothetical protein